ncbi:tetratricopeptide repeat protein [Pannus brasiliensis CCIBt3594]|uniref:Tetratricopeptide repeat protein n=1 Tax=Pannus brasiliensis CCIBt3594 TaxID=1427578 RepID=A0AAW9QF79_9CHRO
MNSEQDRSDIHLSGTAKDNAKMIQVGEMNANIINIGVPDEKLLQRLENPVSTGSGGIYKAGKPRKSLDYWQGRTEDIEIIHGWLRDKNVHLIGIEGIGGIGKSTLTTKIYEERIVVDPSGNEGEDLFPRRFWGEVGGAEGFSGLARDILRSFGYPVPEEEARLQDVLIQRLQSREHLIIIDNLETLFNADGSWNNSFYESFFTAWVEQGDTSTILVTTRERPRLPGVNHWHLLKGLKPSEGAALLTESKISGDLEDFSREVDGHPLLLRLVADLLLAEYPREPSLERLADLGLGNLPRLLTDPRVRGAHRKETVRIALVLDASIHRLSEQQRELFLKTSVYRRDFDTAAAIALLDRTDPNPSEIESDLRELRRRSLLEESWQNQKRSFRFQPLVLEYARYVAGEQTELHQKALNYYLVTAKAKPWQTLEDVKEYLEIFYHWCQLKIYDSAFDILDYIDDFLTLQGYYQTQVDYYQQLVEVYTRQDDKTNWKYPASLIDLGNAYLSLGQYREAIEFYQRSLDIFRESGNRRGEANSCMGLGNAYRSLGQYREAIEFYQRSLDIFRESGDRRGEASSYMGLGNAYRSLGQYREAIEYHQRSLAIFRKFGDRWGEASSYGNLGNAYHFLGQYREAIEFHQQSLAIVREIGDRWGEASVWFNLGITFSKLDSKSEARDAYLRSRELYQAMGLDEYVQRCDHEIQGLKKRKFPFIVAFFLGAFKFPAIVLVALIMGVWRLLRRWLRLG